MKRKQYEHSKTFDSMKVTKEAIADNFTTLQYLQTLDLFIWRALQPLAKACPGLFLNYLAKVVARQTLKASAKLSSDDRSKMPVHLFNSIVALNVSTEKMVEHAKLLYVNRGLLFGLASIFRNYLQEYKELHLNPVPLPSVIRRTKLYRIEQQLSVSPGANLYAALLEVEHWDNKARWFKKLIMEKYTRLAITHAQHAYTAYNHQEPLDDIVQIYLLVVSRAIDRCDARQGVLTVFITNWFKSARGEVAKLCEHQYDQSYEALTEEHGDAIHDIIGVHLPDASLELQEHVAYVAKQVDSVGLVRTALGIPEYVPLKQRLLLQKFVLNPSLASE